jgi:preprotein translocase subunit SecE
VARNRKRAKERRPRKPQPVGGSASGLNGDDAADPLSHAAPDVELAEAQLALGRPELADETPAEHEANERELEDEATEYDDLQDEDGSGDTLAVAPLSTGREARPVEQEAHPPGHRPNILARAFGFLQGSWRELQRVQWPDRRQVMQATGVVIGFVIIAGVFLGVADVLAQHLMNYVLEGHW